MAATSSSAPPLRPITAADFIAQERVSDLVSSPDGRWLAFCRATLNADGKARTSRVWLLRASGTVGGNGKGGEGAPQCVSSPAASSSSPSFHPLGRHLLFLSSRAGAPAQLFCVELPKSEDKEQGFAFQERQLTALPLDVEHYRCSPDGQLCAVSVEVYPDAATLKESAERYSSVFSLFFHVLISLHVLET
jgi:Tol biopolymer transport system component